MGKNTKIVATIVPISFNGTAFRFAVTFTPRLPDSGYLAEYYEILHWYEYLKYFNDNIRVKFNKEDPKEASIKAKFTSIQKSETFWKAMFKKEDPVSGWVLNELPYELADAITHSWLTDQIRNAINNVIEQLMIDPVMDEDDPFRADGNEDRRRIKMASFTEYLEDLKTKDVSIILNDPILTNNQYRSKLNALWEKLREINTQAKEHQAEILLRLSVAEIERRNFEETNEFHKKFSAFANSPYILHQTGWIWEYEISNVEKWQTGLIQIDKDTILNTTTWEADNQFQSFAQEIDFICPYTSIELKINDYLQTASFPGEEKTLLKVDSKTGYVKIKEGMKYEISSEQVDKIQILARIEALLIANYNSTTEELPPGKQNQVKILKQESQNLIQQTSSSNQEYITSGISIQIKNLKQIIEQNLKLQPATNKQDPVEVVAGSGIIFHHNLIAGYRVDVIGGLFGRNRKDMKDIFWTGSLCKKREIYFQNKFKIDEFAGNLPDSPTKLWKVYEGMLIESTQGSNSGKLYVDEELCRWNDSSLIAGDHGDFNDLTYESNNNRLRITLDALSESITPLRFGWKYSFALRVADIIGRSQVPIDHDDSPFKIEKLKLYLSQVEKTDFWTLPIYYQRVEAVNSPILVLGTKLLASASESETRLDVPSKPPMQDQDNSSRVYNDKNNKKGTQETKDSESEEQDKPLPPWIDERWGEDITTMVIRSEYKENFGLTLMSKNEDTVRYLAPPKANWNFVVQHGVLDNFFHKISTGVIIDEQLESLKNEFLDAADTKVDTQIQKVIDGGKLNFMYDPAVEGFEFIINNLISSIPLPPASDLPDYKYWQRVKYYKLVLSYKEKVDDELNPPLSHVLQDQEANFHLRQGCEQDLIVGCDLKKIIDASIGVRTIEIPTRNLFLPGIPQKRRFKIKFVHATQKPCLITQKYKTNNQYFENKILTSRFYTKDRLPGSTTAYFQAEFNQFPILTADTFILHINYFNWVCDRKTDTGYKIMPVSRIVKSNFLPEDSTSEANVVFKDVEHLFDDTRFVMVQYKLEAVSKFRKYFKPTITDSKSKKGSADEVPRDFSIFALFTNTNYLPQQFGVDSNNKKSNDYYSKSWLEPDYRKFITNWLPIKSSKPPATPVIDKVVPLIRWDKKDPNHVKRFCDTIRVYFEGDWYSSGADEKVVVFFMKQVNKNLNVEIDSGNILIPLKAEEIGYDNVISQFGLDPTNTLIDFNDWDNYDWVENLASRFLLNYEAFDRDSIPFEYLPSPVLLEKLDFEKPNKENLKDFKTFGAIYPIQYALPADIESEGKFYIDIQLCNDKIKQFYFPFVRFAIARYQEHADPTSYPLDLRFSKVVTTDFVQLLPYRELKIECNTIELYAQAKRSISDKSANGFSYDTKNELHILNEGSFVSDDRLFEFKSDSQDRFVNILPNVTPSDHWYRLVYDTFPDNFMVAEYEVYINPEMVSSSDTKKGDNQFPTSEPNPQKNYLKRLVFSYVINRISKTKIVTDEEKSKKNK